jgi:hypothetical protein
MDTTAHTPLKGASNSFIALSSLNSIPIFFFYLQNRFCLVLRVRFSSLDDRITGRFLGFDGFESSVGINPQEDGAEDQRHAERTARVNGVVIDDA